MYRNKTVYFLLIFYALVRFARGQGDCIIDGLSESQWDEGLVIVNLDTTSGLLYQKTTSNIIGLTQMDNVLFPLNDSPYLDIIHEDNIFSISLLEKFTSYESNETSISIAHQLWFDCNDGMRSLTVTFNIIDTNNHAPEFLPSNSYNYTILLPVTKDFPVSFVSDIIVRDDDLTNYEIAPEIEENEYFELSYLSVDSTGKNHRLALVAKKPIADFYDMTLEMSVTDVDQTGNPPKTTTGKLKIVKDPLSFPDPVVLEFERSRYTGYFDNDKTVVDFQKEIRLAKMEDDDVSVSLEGASSKYFSVSFDNNNFLIVPTSEELPEETVLAPDAIVVSLVAKNGNHTAVTVLSIQLVKEPNCEFIDLDPDVWETGLVVEIEDTFVGDTLVLTTKNILDVTEYHHSVLELNQPPYVIPLRFEDRIVFRVDEEKFKNYELQETSQNFTMQVDFKCKRNARTLSVTYVIKDTNNHSPTIMSPTNFTFEVFTPIQPNYSISRTYGELIISDLDLTTYAIMTTMTDDYLNATYRARGPGKKNHTLDLVTTRNISFYELPLTTTFTAYDVDTTGDSPNSIEISITLVAKPKPEVEGFD